MQIKDLVTFLFDYKSVDVEIDYVVRCDVDFSTTVTGSGGVLRRVGVEYQSTAVSSEDGGLLTVVDLAKEDGEECTYLATSCSKTFSTTVENAYRFAKTGATKKPGKAEICERDGALTAPEGFIAYNRPMGFSIPDSTPSEVRGLLEATSGITAGDDDGDGNGDCIQVQIDWVEASQVDAGRALDILAWG